MRAAAVGHRREQQRAVRDRLVAGHPQPPAQRARAAERRARPGARTRSRQRRPADVVAELVQPGLERVGTRRPATTSTSTPAPPSSECAISRSAMLTPSRPASVVTSAITPGRSGTGTRSSTSVALPSDARRAGCGAPTRARSSSSSRPSRSPAGDEAAHALQRVEVRVERAERPRRGWPRRCRARSPGWPAAMRVMSRKPPAASRSSVAVLLFVRRSRRPSASTPRAAARGSRPRRARRGARA